MTYEPETRERSIPLDAIDPPAIQHRSELDITELGRLADSINELGLLEAIGLRESASPGRFEVIWGWRRYNAVKMTGAAGIRARVFPASYDADRARAAENEFRQDLNAIERAAVCRRWLDDGLALTEVARRMRREPATITGWLELLSLPADLQAAVANETMAASVARELARVDFGVYRESLIREAIRTGATLRVVASWVAAYAADRERIIENSMAVEEILQRASEYVVRVVCVCCRAEVPMQESRQIRLCAADYATLMQAFDEALAGQVEQPPTTVRAL